MDQDAQLPRHVVWAGVGAGVLLACAVCYGVATAQWHVGSGRGGWTYPFVAPVTWRILATWCVVAAAACALLAAPARPRTMPALLFAWIACATLSHAAIRTTAPFSLEAIYVSPGAHGFYTMAREWRPSQLLSTFNRSRRHAPLHGQSNMPGKTLLVHALTAVTERTSVLPWLLVVVSNLGALLIFALARTLFDDDRVALYAAVLYLFTPGRVLFFPLMNTITPLLALGYAWLVARWLRTGGSAYVVAAGVMLYALVLFEPLPLVMGLFVVALAAAAIARGTISVERFAVQAGVMAVVVGATAAAVYETTGFHMWRAFRQIGAHAMEFNEAAGRPYGIWLRANLLEFLFSAGPAQIVLALTAAGAAWLPAERARERFTRPIVTVSLGLFAVLAAVDLLGINRGEVSRLWIFLACFFQLPAAWLCARLEHRGAIALVLAVSLLQICLAAAAIGFVVP